MTHIIETPLWYQLSFTLYPDTSTRLFRRKRTVCCHEYPCVLRFKLRFNPIGLAAWQALQ